MDAHKIILDTETEYAEWLEHSVDPERLLNTILACKIIELSEKNDWLKKDIQFLERRRANVGCN